MNNKNHGKIPDDIVEKLNRLNRLMTYQFSADQPDEAMKTIDEYNRIYADWYYSQKIIA